MPEWYINFTYQMGHIFHSTRIKFFWRKSVSCLLRWRVYSDMFASLLHTQKKIGMFFFKKKRRPNWNATRKSISFKIQNGLIPRTLFFRFLSSGQVENNCNQWNQWPYMVCAQYRYGGLIVLLSSKLATKVKSDCESNTESKRFKIIL